LFGISPNSTQPHAQLIIKFGYIIHNIKSNASKATKETSSHRHANLVKPVFILLTLKHERTTGTDWQRGEFQSIFVATIHVSNIAPAVLSFPPLVVYLLIRCIRVNGNLASRILFKRPRGYLTEPIGSLSEPRSC